MCLALEDVASASLSRHVPLARPSEEAGDLVLVRSHTAAPEVCEVAECMGRVREAGVAIWWCTKQGAGAGATYHRSFFKPAAQWARDQAVGAVPCVSLMPRGAVVPAGFERGDRGTLPKETRDVRHTGVVPGGG